MPNTNSATTLTEFYGLHISLLEFLSMEHVKVQTPFLGSLDLASSAWESRVPGTKGRSILADITG